MITETISHYRILHQLGAGGMGEVYLAEDTKLNRKVAIKLLPAKTSADEIAKKRLLREAQAAATLDHPNICAVHEVGEADGNSFIVMQYIEGQTLAVRLDLQPLDLREALNIATQVADALIEAHSRGIIHRDIKPQNIMLTDRGHVKVLDFGLARVVQEPDLLKSEAETKSLLTEPGMIVGTVAYMSPEQAAGKVVDTRSDIFSFGGVLYEMVAGQRAFSGDTQMAVLAAVINQEPHPLEQKVPIDLAKLILRCLRKDPARRYQTMSDLRVALEDLREERGSVRQAQKSVLRPWMWLVPISIVALILVGLFVWRPWQPTATAEPLRAGALTTLPGVERSPSLNPDGTQVAFDWTGLKQDNRDIYVQLIGSESRLRLTTDPRDDYNPVWSPDGRWIAFFRGEPSELGLTLTARELRVIPSIGGSDRKLADIQAQDFLGGVYLAWAADSHALVTTDSPGKGQPDALFVFSVETGEKKQLTDPKPPVMADTSPAVSPDGRSLVFLRRTTWGSGELHLLSLGKDLAAAGDPMRLTPSAFRADYPVWMPGGDEIIFSAKGSLWKLVVPGKNEPMRIPYVGEDGLMPTISRPQPGKPARLAYVRSFTDENIWRIETSAPGAPSGSEPVVAISSTKSDIHCKNSPDGRRVAVTSTRTGDWEIWVSDPDGSNDLKLTSMNAQATGAPHWSPDGQLIAFASNVEGEFDIYVVPAAGGKPRRLTSNPAIDHSPTFSRDGKSIYFTSQRSGQYRIWKMPVAGEDAVLVTPSDAFVAFETLDGSSLYYASPSNVSPLWRMPTSGGEPVKVLDGLLWWNFWLLDKGAYYIDNLGTETRLQYLNFVTGKSTTVARNLGNVQAGLTASPDGRTIFFARVDSSADDLMLVENFR